MRGKRRLHQSPDQSEISACRWWIEQERELIRPPLTVALGGTAGRKVGGRFFMTLRTSAGSNFGNRTSREPMLMANVRHSVSP